jgi:hypothetical protein
MQIVSNELDPIIVEGDDLIIDGHVQPFKTELVHLSTKLNDDRAKVVGRGNHGGFFGGVVGNSVTVSVYVRLYHRNADGTRGARVSESAHIKEYEKTLIADDTTWVQATGAETGKILGKVGEELLTEHTQAPLYDEAGVLVQPAGKFYGKTLIKEGQFFNGLRTSAQVTNNIIIQYLTANKSRFQPS